MDLCRGNFTRIFSLFFFCLASTGCVATRNWVRSQLEPFQARLDATDVKAEKSLAALDTLRLEKRFVLGLNDGMNFAFDSTILRSEAARQIDGVLQDVDGKETAIWVITGHTDSVGPEDYNYDLGRRRAESVARYLIAHKGISPAQVIAASYGESSPIDDNSRPEGRRKNRRVEILVYRDVITHNSKQR